VVFPPAALRILPSFNFFPQPTSLVALAIRVLKVKQEDRNLFKLKRVELQGFKSFADRTRLDFGMGTAAIVGPNGCGKSNLSDAISWVLGEQSARMLRGDRMADVIFNGSGKRPPTSMAEVSMTLLCDGQSAQRPAGEQGNPAIGQRPETPRKVKDNPIAAQPAASNADQAPDASSSEEIVVTRRIFRSGESEYLLNGRLCRLRDIQDLFMGTGLGPESYAIIEQGRIGQILSSKPSDRRAIIEEAASISKFKSRKRLAEAKLESSRQNLARITDILEEVSKQVSSLKRQASKAERYQQVHGEYRAKQRVILASRLVEMQASHERFVKDHQALQQVCAECALRLEGIERQARELATQHEALEDQVKQAREKLSQGNLEMERLRSRIDQARREAETLEQRLDETVAEQKQLELRLVTLQDEVTERQRHLKDLGDELAAAEEAVREVAARKEETAKALSAAEGQVESLRQAALVMVSRAAEIRNQLVQAEESGFALDRQLARAGTELEAARADQQRLAADLAQLDKEHKEHSSTFTQLSQAWSEISALLESARSQELICRQKLEGLRDEHSKASARMQALEESLARHAYSTDSVRKLLSAEHRINGSNGFHPLGLLADFVEVTSGYEELVEEFLRTELDSVVVEGHEAARHGMELVESEGGSRTTFFVQKFAANGNGHNPRAAAEAPRPEGVIASLQELVRFEPKLGLGGEVAFPLLVSTYVVESRAAAERLAEAYPLYHFLTPGGEHYHHRTVSGGRKASAGPLALRRNFRELERRTASLHAALESAEAEWAGQREIAQKYELESARLALARQDAEKQSLVVSEKLRQAQAALELVTTRLQTLEQEASLLQEEKRRIEQRHAELESTLAQGRGERQENELALAKSIDATRALRLQLDRLGQDLSAAQSRSSGLREKMSGVEMDHRRLSDQAQETHERDERLEAQARHLAAQMAEWKAGKEKAEELLATLASEQKALHVGLNSLELHTSELRARRDELNHQVDTFRAELESHRERRTAAEVALARAESDLAHHLQRCRQELGLEPEAMLREAGPDKLLEGEELEKQSHEAEALRDRLERMGPVNMMALEELREAEERQAFLDAQRQDLLASINDTAQTIREIDQVSHRQFQQAFHAINGFFAESFRTLFGGGNGEMRLSDESDPESGIDLVAQPPGKRLQNVLLLSGGEKALTALALLIAIFRFTPSPFCILDEVDAPLDDANVERFTRLIGQMSHHTQFILITHNKRTMEICQVLYGVTMQEPGVSRLVSVHMEQVEMEPVALPA
jgi:chromosome segregation protein